MVGSHIGMGTRDHLFAHTGGMSGTTRQGLPTPPGPHRPGLGSGQGSILRSRIAKKEVSG